MATGPGPPPWSSARRGPGRRSWACISSWAAPARVNQGSSRPCRRIPRSCGGRRGAAPGFGWSLEGSSVELMYRSPVDIYIDRWVHELLAAVERIKARRVLVDSLTDLQLASPDEIRFREFVYSLTQRFSRQGVSMMMTMETAGPLMTPTPSVSVISHLSDNLIMLGHDTERGSQRRSMAVIKTRASEHASSVREFTIGPAGITLAHPGTNRAFHRRRRFPADD